MPSMPCEQVFSTVDTLRTSLRIRASLSAARSPFSAEHVQQLGASGRQQRRQQSCGLPGFALTDVPALLGILPAGVSVKS